MSRLLFISDLHLSPQTPALVQRFHQLLEQNADRLDGLYILGDLFDAWIGDDDPSPFADEIRNALKAFSNGTPLFLQRGNRDFMLAGGFERDTGASILEDEHLLEVDGQRLLLMHGDQLCTDDVEYQQVRVQVRSPAFRQQALLKSIEERRALAEEYRRRSGESLSLKPADITDVNRQAVDAAMRSHGAGLLVHGHTHRPAMHSFELDGQPVRRLVLPDWREEEPRVGLEWKDGELSWRTLNNP